jgi:hypothetical protein
MSDRSESGQPATAREKIIQFERRTGVIPQEKDAMPSKPRGCAGLVRDLLILLQVLAPRPRGVKVTMRAKSLRGMTR